MTKGAVTYLVPLKRRPPAGCASPPGHPGAAARLWAVLLAAPARAAPPTPASRWRRGWRGYSKEQMGHTTTSTPGGAVPAAAARSPQAGEAGPPLQALGCGRLSCPPAAPAYRPAPPLGWEGCPARCPRCRHQSTGSVRAHGQRAATATPLLTEAHGLPASQSAAP